MMTYKTVKRALERTEEIKASRFIAYVAPIKNVEAASQTIEARREVYPDASHHCWAYRVAEQMRFSDDGEPGGTAGRPMAEVLRLRELDHIVAIVSRYFGGTKLGAGGLLRAYGGSLAKALDAAGETLVRSRVKLCVSSPFAEVDTLHRFLDAWPALQKEPPEYEAAGVRVVISLPDEDVEQFDEQLRELTRGSARLEPHKLKAG